MKRCTQCGAIKPREHFYRANGPKANKDGLRPRCKDCVKAAALADYYRSGPKDPEKNREATRRFRERHPGKDAEYGRKYRETHGERYKQMARARHLRHRSTKPERHVASEMKRRAKLIMVTEDDREYIATLRRDPCSYCGANGVSTVDHIEPLHYGGVTSWDNLTAACRSCNTSKKTSDLLLFLLRKSA